MPQEQETELNDDSPMREYFEAAIDTVEGDSEPSTSEGDTDDTVTGVDDTSTIEQEKGSADTEGDKKTEGSDANNAPEQRESAEATASEHDDAQVSDDVEHKQRTKQNLKAPVGWPPKAREQWSKLDTDVQEHILTREKEVADTVANTKQARQTHEAFTELSNKFAPVLAAEGVNPMQAVESLFNTTAQLRVGTPTQKAKVIAEIIDNYGVDIRTLDTVLAGQPPANSEDDRLKKMFDEQFGPLINQLQDTQTQNANAATQRANDEVAEFGKNAEFINDVRLDMADILDAYAARGKKLTLQQAYDIACQGNPEIKEVLDARAEKERLGLQNDDVARKKAAASSLSGKKTGVENTDTSNMSIRDSINAAMDSQGRA